MYMYMYIYIYRYIYMYIHTEDLSVYYMTLPSWRNIVAIVKPLKLITYVTQNKSMRLKSNPFS